MFLIEISPNLYELSVGDQTVWFSYTVPIGFTSGVLRITRQNVWGTTTSKHLNIIDGGSKVAIANRLTSEEFEKRLMETYGEKTQTSEGS